MVFIHVCFVNKGFKSGTFISPQRLEMYMIDLSWIIGIAGNWIAEALSKGLTINNS